MSELSALAVPLPDAADDGTRRLMLFFAVVYLAEGFCQSDGLIAQPLNYYLKQVHGWTPVQITGFLTVFNLPWFFKPFYGMVSDFVPLFGFRRKSWLVLANLAAAAAYFAVIAGGAPGTLLLLLLSAAYGMAIVSTIAGAVLVENGSELGASRRFVNQQWLWFNVAAVAASLLGGLFVQWLTPLNALHGAAFIAAMMPLVAAVATVALVRERSSGISLHGLRTTLEGLIAALRSRQLLVLGAFLFFFYFSPGIDTPLYFFMTDRLKLGQAYIGFLNSVSAVGGVVAGIIYAAYLRRLSTRAMLYLSIAAGVAGTLSFVFMTGPVTAAAAQFCYGAVSMWTLVATLGLAAELCPERAEGFGFAAMLAVTNLAGAAADNVGSWLYEHVFDSEISPLIVVAAGFTAINLVLVPLLRLEGHPSRLAVSAGR